MRDAVEVYRNDLSQPYGSLLGVGNELKEVCNTGTEQFISKEKNCENSIDLRVLVPNYLDEVPYFENHSLSIGLNKVNNELSIVVKAEDSSEVYSLNSNSNVENQDFIAPGDYSFIVPNGVSEIAAIVIGGGGGGGQHAYGSFHQGGGGGGGGLRYGKKISVIPGEELFVTVGVGGAAGAYGERAPRGGDSCLKRGDVTLLVAKGGEGGTWNWPGGTAAGGDGTPFSEFVSGGNGGRGAGPGYFHNYSAGLFGAGGGGAGGYSGNGGDGGGAGMSAQNGTGGGGGGGNIFNWVSGGSGGGVGLEGEGVSGISGTNVGGADSSARSGSGGSGGQPGATNSSGGAYGGGGGGMGWPSPGVLPASGGSGAVKIMWIGASE